MVKTRSMPPEVKSGRASCSFGPKIGLDPHLLEDVTLLHVMLLGLNPNQNRVGVEADQKISCLDCCHEKDGSNWHRNEEDQADNHDP